MFATKKHCYFSQIHFNSNVSIFQKDSQKNQSKNGKGTSKCSVRSAFVYGHLTLKIIKMLVKYQYTLKNEGFKK